MTKKIHSLFALLFVAGLVGCNPFGTKDELIARVGDEKIYRSDFDLARIMQPAYNKPEKYAELLSNLIADREFVIAAREKLGDPNESVEKRMASLHDRLLTRIYQQFYVVENLGHTEEQLLEYYEKHPDLFKNDTCKFFTDCRISVAKKVYLAENADSLNVFFESRLKSYKKPAEVELAYFKSNDSLSVEKVQKSLELNKVVDSIPGMVREKLTETQNHALLKTMAVRESLFGKNALKVDGSFKTLKVQTNEKSGDSSYFVILKVMSRTPAVEKTLEEVRPSLEQAFIDSYVDKMMREGANTIKEKFALQLEKIEPPNPRAYYDSHKDNYKTTPGFEVYHIESTDSLALMKVVNQPLTLVDFKKLASSMSMNEATKVQGGFLGEVKVSHALPFGIGMMPELFDEFKGKQPGAVSSVIKAPNTGRYHVFYLNKEVPSEVKPFERVEAQVKKEIAQSGDFALDSSYVLATSKGKPVIYERDVLNLQSEIPPEERRLYPRSRLLQYMIDWKAYALESEALGLDESWYFKAIETSSRVGIYNKLLNDSLQLNSWGVSEAELKAGYEKYGKTVFGGAAFDKISNSLGLFLTTPEILLKREYYFNLDQYASFPNFEAAEGTVFSSLIGTEKRTWMLRYRAELSQKTPVYIYDSLFLPRIDRYSRDSLLKRADVAYKARDLSAAVNTWSDLRSLYAEDDTLFARATLEIAKIFNENEKYDFAQREYRAYVSLWPKNPEAENALFSRAFILHENLKQDSVALTLFREFKAKYPKSELMESVDWLIRNIESNGKLAEELLEKISKQDESAK